MKFMFMYTFMSQVSIGSPVFDSFTLRRGEMRYGTSRLVFNFLVIVAKPTYRPGSRLRERRCYKNRVLKYSVIFPFGVSGME